MDTTGIDESRGGVTTAPRPPATDSPSWLARINSSRHHLALKIYIGIVVAHWIEHLVQVVQIYILNMPRPQAGGFIGYLIPTINKDEILHWTYAVLMFTGLLLLRPGFKARSRTWWNVAIGIMVWHFIEHTFLLYQYWSEWHFLDKPVPTSFVQTFFPRFELHLIYNMLVMLPILAAISVHWLGPKEAGPQGDCDCRSHFR